MGIRDRIEASERGAEPEEIDPRVSRIAYGDGTPEQRQDQLVALRDEGDHSQATLDQIAGYMEMLEMRRLAQESQ